MDLSPPDLTTLIRRTGAWLQGSGAETDIVLSSRVRLARNLVGLPFPARLPGERAAEVPSRLLECGPETTFGAKPHWVTFDRADALLQQVLFERNLASKEMLHPKESAAPEGRAVLFGEAEDLAVLVGEEDHLRLQALAPGLALDEAFDRVVSLDQDLQERLEYATHARLGYLTACPSNVGTGMRASVMLHLPGLGAQRRELDRVFSAAQHTGLAVRGLHGEGSKAAGDLYQISNQVTLGASERALIEGLQVMVDGLVRAERQARAALVESMQVPLKDRIARSLATLRTARSINTGHALRHLSIIRLGQALGLIDVLELRPLDHLALRIQKGHLQAEAGIPAAEVSELLDASERRKLRASLLRAAFAGRG